MALVTFILLLGVSLAACPNGCSSHGTCNIDGSCTCFRQTGLALNGAYFDDFSWTGPDCSLKTCPKDFSFAPSENIDEWYTNNDAVEMTITEAGNCENDCSTVGVPRRKYVLKLTTDVIDPAFSDYGIGGSITCYKQTHRRLYYGSFTVLKTGEKLLYAVQDIHAGDDEVTTKPLYCYADYVRKDLSLFIQFGFTKGTGNNQYEVTLQSDVSTLLRGYIGERAVIDLKSDPLHVVCVNGRVSTGSKSNLFSLYEFNATMKTVDCKAGPTALTTTPYGGCIQLTTPEKSQYNIGDKCFLLESGISTDNIHRNIKLESSELYHMTGVDKGNIYFGRKLIGSAIGYYVPSDTQFENKPYTGTDPTANFPTMTGLETEDPTFVNEPETNGSLQVTIDFRYYCGGVNCSKYTQDWSIKSVGEFFQYITPGAHVNVIRLLTTRETEDHQYEPDHACYAHFIQLTIAAVNNLDSKNGRVTLTFNRPYKFAERSTNNHYAYLFQFNAVGPHTAVECSNQGKCNRATGKCECFDGFEGDSCQRMQCPNSCSQHGRCLAINELVTGETAESLSEPMFGDVRSEKLYGCKCDKNYRGADCSLRECPSGKDPIGAVNKEGDSGEYRDCSGRGSCDYTTGKCTCYDGFTGSDCSTLITM